MVCGRRGEWSRGKEIGLGWGGDIHRRIRWGGMKKRPPSWVLKTWPWKGGWAGTRLGSGRAHVAWGLIPARSSWAEGWEVLGGIRDAR